MDCEECRRLHAEAAGWWRAYQIEKDLGRARSPRDSKEDELLRLYKLTAARERVHRSKTHPKDGYGVSFDDLELTAEFE